MGEIVAYVAGHRMMPTNPLEPPPRVVGTKLAFAFSCISMAWIEANVGLPMIHVRSLYGKYKSLTLWGVEIIVDLEIC